MRADRLVATLLVMQARGRVTASELATELETSVATARRDLEALSAAGIPVYPQAGRGGGWQLLGGARTDLSGLNSAEARALFLLVGPAAALDPDAKAALRKLVRALPETFRADAEAAAGSVVIDPARWGRPTKEQPPLVRELQDAVVARRRVALEYGGWNREATMRTVDPWGLVEKNDTWYLIAGVDGQQRTYRVDRIQTASVTDDTSERPADFDLATAWGEIVSDVTRQRERTKGHLVAERHILPYLRAHFGPTAVDATDRDDGRSDVTIAAPTEELIARGIAGWAEFLEIVDPDSLRTELARIGAELIRRHER